MAPPPCSWRSLLLVLLGAAALAAPGAEAQQQQGGGGYCDGSGGLQSAYGWGSDPSCRGVCLFCSAAQVLAAMEAAPDDSHVQ